MPTRHEIRRLAIQALYQLDIRGQGDAQVIREDLASDSSSTGAGPQAFDLAMAAWDRRDQIDALVSQLAPHWPTHRQPPLDRAILRLAGHEITAARVPARVAINEAVVLAKQFCAEQSPGFINGVLDKMARRFDPNRLAGVPVTPASGS